MAVVAQREKNSFHPQVPAWEEKAKRAFPDGRDHQSKTPELPFPSCILRLQSWLLCGRTAEGVTHLSPSEGAPILSLTNLHRSVECGRLHQGHLHRFRHLSHRDGYSRLSLHGQCTSTF
jgi:hypothetical protein